MNVLHEIAGFRRGGGALFGQASHFICHDAEPLPMFSRARGLDGGIQGQQVRHVGQLANRCNEPGNAPAHLAELLHLARALADERLERDQALDRLANLRAVAAGDVARRGRCARRARAVVRHAPRDLRQGLGGLQSA